MVSRLLKANAYVNAIDHEGDTPLHTAGVYAEAACVQLLLDWAACLWTRNLQGETPLIAAADCGGSPKTISLLLASGPPTSWVDVLLMGLYRVMTHLGYSSRQLFVTCRQFSLQQEFYPSAFHGGAFPFQLLGTPPRNLFVTCKRLSLQREFCPLVLFGGATSSNFFLPSMSASASFPTCSLDILQTETPPCLDLLHLPTSVLSHLLGFCFSLATLCPLASSCDSLHHVITSAGTWSGQTLLLRPCACKQLCANQCLRAVCAATPHYGEYAAIAHLNFQLNAPTQRKPALRAWNHCHDSTHGMNFWHTGLNNQAPPVFDVSIFLGTSPCLLHSIPDLHLLIGVFASTSSASLLQLPSPDQALPFNMAAARFHIRHGTCQAIDVASASSFHPADCQHALDFRSRRSFTVVCNQQDQIFSLFDSDGERLLSLSGLRLPKDAPINSFVCLLSPSFSLPSCAVTEDVHRRPRVRATQPHLQKGYSIFHLLPHCTVIGGALLSLESGQRSLPLSLPLLCFCAAVFFHALDYCLLLSGGGGAVELSQHGKPLWCSLHDSSDESDSPAVASPLTTAVPSGAVVSLFDTLDAPDPAPRAEQVAVHQDAFDEQVTRLYADVLDSSSIRASFLQSWRDLFQFEDGDLISRCARLHSENMDWRIFFVNGAYRETPMPLSLAPFLLKGMQCPAVLLWNLGSHALHLLTETETTCWHWHLTLEGFPCIAWNSFTQRYFAIPAAIPAFGDSHMSSAVENSSVSVHVKILEFQTACAKLLATEAFFSSFETTRMECLDAMPKELDLDPSLAHIGRCLSPRALRQVCSSRVISLPLGLVLWVFDSNVLLHVSPSTSLRPICLAEGIGLLQLGAALMCCRPSLKMLNRALLQVGQVWFGSVPKSAARATLLLVHLANLHGGFSRSCLFSFVRGGASPLQDMCYLCAVLTCAGDIKTVLTLAKVSTRISSMLRPPNVFPAMRVFISQCNCNRLCFNQCLLSLQPQGFSFHCILSTATVDEIIGGTPFLQNIAHSLDHCQTFWMSRTPTPALFTIKLSLSQLLLRKPALTVFLGLVTSDQPQAIGSSLLWPDHVVPAPHCVVRLTLHQGMCSLLRWQTHRQQSCYEAISPFTFHLPQVRLSFVLGPDTARLFGTDGVALSTLQLPSRWPSSFGRTCKAIVSLYCPDHLPLPTVDVATRVEPIFTFVPQALSARGRLHVLKKTLLWGELANTNPFCDSSDSSSVVAGGFSFFSFCNLEQFYQPQSTPTVTACNVASAPPISLDCKQKKDLTLSFISNDTVWTNSKTSRTCFHRRTSEVSFELLRANFLLRRPASQKLTLLLALLHLGSGSSCILAGGSFGSRQKTRELQMDGRILCGGASSCSMPAALESDEWCSLLNATPEAFDKTFAKIYQQSPERAQIVARYMLANLVSFPTASLQEELPAIYEMTTALAQKAGCPFEWAFLLFLPLLGTACSKARLYINEFFLVPPLLWIGLCLDSGANKSGVMTALADIISGFEKALLEDALNKARSEHELDQHDAEEEDVAEGNADGAKKRKISLSKALASIRQNKPALFSDEGSLPAIGLQMSQNGHRAIGLYDEGRFLLRALSNGEGSGFNASTMAKLFNGSVWKRTVVKDHNRFAMHQTCLCLAMTFHVEEWHDFLGKDGVLGMQSRFLTFHSSPRLDKASAVLDSDVYGRNQSQATLQLPESLLTQFVQVLRFTDQAHTEQSSDFDKSREFIPYFFAADALHYFTQQYDARVVEQERAYLQDPKLFSHAGKLKSLPWRLALLLHSWTHACAKIESPDASWTRKLSKNVVEISKAIFDYLSLQSLFLSPASDLFHLLGSSGLAMTARQKYPTLVELLENKTLSVSGLRVDSIASSIVPLAAWWDAMDPDSKIYCVIAAHWILCSATTLIVDQSAVLKKLHNKDTGIQLQKETARAHVLNAFLLLHHGQLGMYLQKNSGHRLRKRPFPPQALEVSISFSNLLNFFKHKLSANRDLYNQRYLLITESLRKTFKSDIDGPELPPADRSQMDALLLKLTEFRADSSTDPFTFAPKILNFKQKDRESDRVEPVSGGVLPSYQASSLHTATIFPPWWLSSSKIVVPSGGRTLIFCGLAVLMLQPLVQATVSMCFSLPSVVVSRKTTAWTQGPLCEKVCRQQHFPSPCTLANDCDHRVRPVLHLQGGSLQFHLPTSLQMFDPSLSTLILTYNCVFPDVLHMCFTCKHVHSLLLRTKALHCLRLRFAPCTCAVLCLNQCLDTLVYQGFPLQRQLALGRSSLPSVHRTWVVYRHGLRTQNVWLAEHESPRVSTVLVQLSTTLQDLEHLELFLGMGVSNNVTEVCRSLLSPQQGAPPQCAIRLLIQRNRCARAQWQSAFQHFAPHAVSVLRFNRPHKFTFLLGEYFVSVFDTHGGLISRFRLPEHWQIPGTRPTKAFVLINALVPILPPSRDHTTIIQPLATRCPQARSFQPKIRARSSELEWFCGDAGPVFSGGSHRLHFGQRNLATPSDLYTGRFFHTIHSLRQIFKTYLGPVVTGALNLMSLRSDTDTFRPTSFQFDQEDKDSRRLASLTGGSLPDYRGVLYPATVSMLPAFVLANYVADAHCRGQLASSFLHQSTQRHALTTSDCNFVFQKLCMYAPHLLGTELTLPTDLPYSAIVPSCSNCPTCAAILVAKSMHAASLISGLDTVQLVQIQTFQCPECKSSFQGPWQHDSGKKTLTTTKPCFFNTTPKVVFTASFLQLCTRMLVHCGGSLQGLAKLLPEPCCNKHMETLLRDSWLQFSLAQLLQDKSLDINWHVGRNKMEAWCRKVEPLATEIFQSRWLHQHKCLACSKGILGIDGNAKVRTKLCANTDDGVWNCSPLNAHCLTGCQNPPVPGKRFCAYHLQDTEPVLGSDFFVMNIATCLLGPTDLVPMQSFFACQALPCCRRLFKALTFALLHAEGKYPVVLNRVQKISRSRRYFFTNSAGKTFALLSSAVPLRFQELFGFMFVEPESRECQEKPRIGNQLKFTQLEQQASCRAQWLKTTKARRSGGLLAAVKECQVVAALKLVYTHESPTGVYFFLAELLQDFAKHANIDLKKLTRKKRVAFVRQKMPLVWYDCACTLKRFMTAKRKKKSKLARAMAKLHLVIDKFHFRKGHSGCRENGSSPLPAVWPKTHASSFGKCC